MTATALEPTLLSDVAQAIALRTGLSFPAERWPDLDRDLHATAARLSVADHAAWARRIVTGELSPHERQILIDRLTIGETYFWREPAALEVLQHQLLPRLFEARGGTSRALSLWSAGCCSGEEAYSIAIAGLRAREDLATWRVDVLGTDLNEQAIAKARRGVYGPWSFRGTPDWLRPQYFTNAGAKAWEIGPDARALVRFATHNLAAEPFPSGSGPSGAWDVIFCRNVIMYLTPEHQRRAMGALSAALADDGYLVLSPAEGGQFAREWFRAELVGDAIVYRKAPAETTALPRSAPDPAAPARRPPRSRSALAPARPAIRPAAAQPEPAMSAATADDLLVQARAHADQGDLRAAIPLCEAALARDPACSAAGYLMATILGDLGRIDEEAAALRQVLNANPAFILAHRALGDLERRRGRPAEARRHFRQALGLLEAMDRAEMVPESGGITAGRLAQAIARSAGG